MPKNKDFKRRVRDRMAKTGESYTAARAQLLGRDLLPLPDDYAALAGHTDATLLARTGRTWPEWCAVLDELGATEMSHRDIASWVKDDIDDGWWAQSVTVGYERIRGRREPGQMGSGEFQASKSCTLPVPAEAAHAALCELGTDSAWLDGLSFRGATAPKSVRFEGPDGSRAAVWIATKAGPKCTVSVSHTKLPTAEAKEVAKQAWATRLAALQAQLSGG